jgi:hypothetical protein
MMTCKTCGKKCDGEYCFQHKPRKPLAPTKGFKVKVPEKHPITEMNPMKDMFLSIWKKRPHKSEVSGESLGSEPLSTFFHHILPKNKYLKASLDEENIILLTWEEHDQVESDIYRFEEINKRREQLKKKYEIH